MSEPISEKERWILKQIREADVIVSSVEDFRQAVKRSPPGSNILWIDKVSSHAIGSLLWEKTKGYD